MEIGFTIIAQIVLLLITGSGPLLFFLNREAANR